MLTLRLLLCVQDRLEACIHSIFYHPLFPIAQDASLQVSLTRKELIFDPLAERIDDLYEKILERPDIVGKDPQTQTGILKKINKALTNGTDFDKSLKKADIDFAINFIEEVYNRETASNIKLAFQYDQNNISINALRKQEGKKEILDSYKVRSDSLQKFLTQ